MPSSIDIQDETQLLLAYCKSLSLEFQQRVDRMGLFVKHNLTAGNAREAILRNFLRSHIANGFEVGQGFIYDYDNLQTSKQCDILVYYSGLPLVYFDGDIKIVQKEAARMVIEVKTNFDKKEMERSFQNIEAAKSIEPHYLQTVIFSFQSPGLETVLRNLRSMCVEPERGPDAILLFDKNLIIHRWDIARHDDDPASKNKLDYSVRKGIGQNAEAVVVMCLLSCILNAAKTYDQARSLNMLRETVKTYTVRICDDIEVGGNTSMVALDSPGITK